MWDTDLAGGVAQDHRFGPSVPVAGGAPLATGVRILPVAASIAVSPPKLTAVALTDGTLDTDAILHLLRASGGRATATRRVTIDVILAAGDEHLNAEEILNRVRRQVPDVAESTVYRTLGSLEELGVITHLHLGHGPSTYHQASNAHQHLVCQVCASITDVPDAIFDDLAAGIDRDYGFAIDPRHFALQGVCADCLAAGRRPTPA